MWRYLVGGIAALAMVAAGWLVFNGRAQRGNDAVPIAAAPAAGAPGGPIAEPDRLPEAPERTREQKRFGRYDKDRDGRITRDEYLASRRKAFAKLDSDGDGRLSFDEWAVKTRTRFADADRDRSGAMDAGEFASTAPKRKAARPACRCTPAASVTEE